MSTAHTVHSAQSIGDTATTSSTSHHHHHHHSKQHDNHRLGNSSQGTQVTRRPTESHENHRQPTHHDLLHETARAMLQNVEVKDRKYHLKTYRDCFVGQEAITFLKEYMQLHSRKEALKYAQEMNKALHFCEHVTHDHHDQIEDAYLFYRFTDFCSTRSFTLLEVLRAFQRGVRTQDRTYRLRTYQNVFVGREAVDFLVHYKFAHSRQAAVQLGQQLASKYDLFVHVAGEHDFKDEYVFYRMLVPNIHGGVSEKCREVEERKALKSWVIAFTIVAIVLYYYLF